MDLGCDLNINKQPLWLFEYVNNVCETEVMYMVSGDSKNREQEDQIMHILSDLKWCLSELEWAYVEIEIPMTEGSAGFSA